MAPEYDEDALRNVRTWNNRKRTQAAVIKCKSSLIRETKHSQNIGRKQPS